MNESNKIDTAWNHVLVDNNNNVFGTFLQTFTVKKISIFFSAAVHACHIQGRSVKGH